MEVQLPAHSCGTPGERPQGPLPAAQVRLPGVGWGGKTSSQLGSAETMAETEPTLPQVFRWNPVPKRLSVLLSTFSEFFVQGEWTFLIPF